jgi:hypothetical protein
MESFSDEEEEEISNGGPGDEAPSEVRELLCRKVELERTQRRQELHKQRVKVKSHEPRSLKSLIDSETCSFPWSS